jgi:DNA-binding PadR family transcriptional regulator
MKPLSRVTTTTLMVLDALTQGDDYGFTIIQRTGLGSGTIYPILKRLEDAGWVTSHWEIPEPGGRPRRYYRIPAGAQTAVNELLKERGLTAMRARR